METTKYKVQVEVDGNDSKEFSAYVFKVADSEFSVRFYEFKMADPI